MVDSSSCRVERPSGQDSRSRPNHSIRCVECGSFGLGRLLWAEDDRWPVDNSRKATARQCPRVAGYLLYCPLSCMESASRNCVASDGQRANEVAVACIRCMGSNSSLPLNSIARELCEWCLARQITPIPEYISGIVNTIADYQSCHHNDTIDWISPRMLDRSVFQSLQQVWSVNYCDLFACRTNTQLPT